VEVESAKDVSNKNVYDNWDYLQTCGTVGSHPAVGRVPVEALTPPPRHKSVPFFPPALSDPGDKSGPKSRHVMASSRNPDALKAPPPAAEPAEAQPPNPSILPGDPPSPEMEATAEALTREEVLHRRRRRAAQLSGVYRWLYWAMAEEVRAKHLQYVWDLGRSPLEAEQPPPPPGAAAFPGNGKEAPRPIPVPRRKKCGFPGCKVRAMPITKFCLSHIFSDPNQALYKPCTYFMKRFVSWMLSSSFYSIRKP
jgi:hypothetical protein